MRSLLTAGWCLPSRHLNRPGFAGDQIVRLRDPIEGCSGLHETRLLCFSGWDISDGLKQAAVVEPVDPIEGFRLDLVRGAP